MARRYGVSGATAAGLLLGLWTVAGAALAGPPAHDTCAGRKIIFAGTTPFSNAGAHDDGPVPSCGDGRADLWFEYHAQVTGRATISTCDSDFDTVLAVYIGAYCPTYPSLRLACNDDACRSRASLEIDVIEGVIYLVQVGGHLGAEGSGKLSIVEENECRADLSGDCEVDVSDFIDLLLRWGSDDEAADLNDDGVVGVGDVTSMILAWGLCAPCLEGCGQGEGDCCDGHGTPGCANAGCCTAVCSVDPSCCHLIWDLICAETSATICQDCP